MFTTPILFVIFNRPKNTEQVFQKIRELKPLKLYIIADGPRSSKPGEAKLCRRARQVASKVDWPCQIFRNYSNQNMGCRERLISGIDWFFDHEKEGIILEDDCLPSTAFFYFCQTLLSKYRNNEKVMHIGGNNFQYPDFKCNNSYYFSKYSHIWGWATWRRAWRRLDKSMSSLDKFISDGSLKEYCFNFWEYRYWRVIFNNSRSKTLSAWSYNWLYTIWKLHGLSIVPAVNLVKNLGFSQDATNTSKAQPFLKTMRADNLKFPLRHPKLFEINRQADLVVWYRVFRVPVFSIIMNIPKTLKYLLNTKI